MSTRRTIATALGSALALAGCSAVLGIGDLPDPAAGASDAPIADALPTPACEAGAPCDAGPAAGPTIDGLAPTSAYRGAADLTVIVTGAGFAPTATVRSGATTFATTFVSPGKLSFVLPATLLAKTGSIALVVQNPDQSSPPTTFVVSGCDSAGVDVPLGAAISLVTRPTDIATSVLTAYSAPRGLGPLGFSPRDCPLAYSSTIVTRYRGFVVQNTTDGPLRLSAWAACATSNDTGYLGFYRRATVPISDAELRDCAGHAAAGTGGGAGFGAPPPDNAFSSYCPGLYIGNGGAIPIAACEKVVVVVEAYDDANSWPAPPEIRFRADAP